MSEPINRDLESVIDSGTVVSKPIERTDDARGSDSGRNGRDGIRIRGTRKRRSDAGQGRKPGDEQRSASATASESQEKRGVFESPPGRVDFASLFGGKDQTITSSFFASALEILFNGMVMMGAGEHWALSSIESKMLADNWIKALKTLPKPAQAKWLKLLGKHMPYFVAAGTTLIVCAPRIDKTLKRGKKANGAVQPRSEDQGKTGADSNKNAGTGRSPGDDNAWNHGDAAAFNGGRSTAFGSPVVVGGK